MLFNYKILSIDFLHRFLNFHNVNMIIPIGIQCLNRELKKSLHKDSESLPFDWILSHPKFVYAILKLLLEYDKFVDVEEIVNNHFFYCDKRVSSSSYEKFHTDSNGRILYNSVYDVIYPHDVYDNETKKNM